MRSTSGVTPTKSRQRAFIGLGSNLDSPVQQLASAISALQELGRVAAVSSVYRSAPVGYLDQPDFLNAVAEIETSLPPHGVLAVLHEIELRHGRTREFRNAPRSLDLDLLVYGAVRLRDERLELPHPRAHERAFVLVPLFEIAPELEIPGRGRVRAWLDSCRDQRVEPCESPDAIWRGRAVAA